MHEGLNGVLHVSGKRPKSLPVQLIYSFELKNTCIDKQNNVVNFLLTTDSEPKLFMHYRFWA